MTETQAILLLVIVTCFYAGYVWRGLPPVRPRARKMDIKEWRQWIPRLMQPDARRRKDSLHKHRLMPPRQHPKENEPC